VTGRRRVLLLAVAIGVTLLVAGCYGPDRAELGLLVDEHLPQNSLNPAGPEARKIDGLWWMVFWIATAVFVLVQAALVFAIVRFRRRKGQDRPVKQVHGNTKLEIAWTIVPAVILAVIAVPTVATLFDMREEPRLPEEDVPSHGGDRPPVVVGVPLPGVRVHHRRRDAHPGRSAGVAVDDLRRRDPLLLGAELNGKRDVVPVVPPTCESRRTSPGCTWGSAQSSAAWLMPTCVTGCSPTERPISRPGRPPRLSLP
jgi:hypothetical protein